MKGILIFKLPEEEEEFKLAQKGPAYSAVVEELDNWLRQKQKYDDIETISIEEVRKHITELLEEYVNDSR